MWEEGGWLTFFFFLLQQEGTSSMKTEQPAIVRTRPIREVTISIDPRYVSGIKQYMEKLGCRVTQGTQGYHIAFPEGTEEATPAGQSTQWAHRTIIHFPNGQALNRTIFAPITPEQKSMETLYFPVEILEPEPAQQRRV
jgi:hypothetical protein